MEIISRYSDIPGIVIDEAKIPPALRELLPLAVEWSITDYLELDAYVKAAPEAQRRHFVDSFARHQNLIAEWIKKSSHLMPLPDEVAIFDIAADTSFKVGKTLPSFGLNLFHPELFEAKQETDFIGAD